jgi:hypothetical protein
MNPCRLYHHVIDGSSVDGHVLLSRRDALCTMAGVKYWQRLGKLRNVCLQGVY